MNQLHEAWAGIAATILHQLATASLAGGLALLAAWILNHLLASHLPARLRCWAWRLAFAKLLLLLFVSRAIELAWLPALAVAPGSPSGVTEVATTAPQALPLEAPARPIDPYEVLAAVWLLFATMALARMARGWLQSRRIRAAADPVLEGELLVLLHSISRELGVRRPPELASTKDARGPMLVGLFAPTVILPAHALGRPPQQLRMIMAHEVGHFARNDLVWDLLPALARCLFFFHPLVWIGNSEMLVAQEVATDELVLGMTQETVRNYGELLISFVSAEPTPSFVTMHAAGTARLLKRRLSYLGHMVAIPAALSPMRLILLGGVGMLLLTPWRLVRAPPLAAPAESDSDADPSAAPVPLDKPGMVTLAVKDALVETVLEQITLHGNYDLALMPLKPRLVTAYLSGASMREALEYVNLATGSELEYVVKGKTIVIREKHPSTPGTASTTGPG